MNAQLVAEAEALLSFLRERGLRLAAAESCTGGLVVGYLTEIPGASDVVERGFVTYSNAAKTQLLGVEAGAIASVGAVSKDVALAMAAGALGNSAADISVAVTGVAGPEGGTPEKPVGLVHFAAARVKSRENGAVSFAALHHEERFGPLSRRDIRERSVVVAFALLRRAADLR